MNKKVPDIGEIRKSSLASGGGVFVPRRPVNIFSDFTIKTITFFTDAR